MNWMNIADQDEKHFLKMVIEYNEKASRQYRMLSTPFYNRDWMEEVLNRYHFLTQLESYTFLGGYEYAERQVLAFGYEETYMECPIRALKITVKTGIGKPLSHRDFLGALLGLGIKRETIGDIIPTDFGAYVIVQEEMSDFIGTYLTGIGRYQKITVEEITFEEMQIESPKTKAVTGTVPSLRVDAIFALAFGVSRSEVVKLLEQERGKVNGMSVRGSQLMKVGDTGTLRGYGKMRLSAINGYTKKERMHLTIEKFI